MEESQEHLPSTDSSIGESDGAGKGDGTEFPIVGIGASAGGVRALTELFTHIPGDTGMAFIVVHYIVPDQKRTLAGILRTHTPLRVQQVRGQRDIRPNHIYVVPPGKVLSIRGRTLRLSDRVHEPGLRSTIDLLFESLAEAQEERSVGIVLSGQGRDGTLGLKCIKEHGGLTMAQTEDDAAQPGMPKSAIQSEFVDVVGTARELAEGLLDYQRGTAEIALPIDALSEQDEAALQDIFSYLQNKTGHDFTEYKRSTILRRLERRMQLHRFESIPQYLGYLHHHARETRALLKDLLISVTRFFRDAETFTTLREQVIPHIFAGKDSNDTVRVWAAGCATGEEAYSLAMLLCEFASGLDNSPQFQIFATDIDEGAIAVAREAVYPRAIAEDVSPERLERFFQKEAGGFRVKQELREHVLFAPHDLLKDPPFSQLDLISCRNVLIYLNRHVQDRVLQTFHYALGPGGFLFLGPSESADSSDDIFTSVDKGQSIFRRRDVSPYYHSSMVPLPAQSAGPSLQTHRRDNLGLIDHYEALVLKRHAPACLLVNEQFDVVRVVGGAGRYLHDADGALSFNVLDKIHPMLRVDAQTALYRAFREGEHTTIRPVSLELDGRRRRVQLHIGPIDEPGFPTGHAEILFEEQADTFLPTVSEVSGDDKDPRTAELQEELKHTRARMQMIIEEYQTTNEELKTSNEELLSMNEELRSTTEELETSKEELQATNEELTTVNYELEAKIEQLHRLTNDLQNLMESTDIGILFLDRDLCVKRFTPAMEDIFYIIAADVGRPLIHLSHTLEYDEFTRDARHVLETLTTVEYELRSRDDRWFLVRLTPYRTIDDKIDGVVITFVDMTDQKRTEHLLEQRVQQQAAVAELGQLALEGADLDLLRREAVQRVAATLDVDFCKVLELLPHGEALMLKAGVGWMEGLVGHATVGTELDSQAGYTLYRDEPIIVEDLRTEQRFSGPALLVDHEVVSGVSVVIEGAERPYGVLGAHTKYRRRFTEDDVNFVQSVANVIADAVTRRRIEQELQDANTQLEARVAERTRELSEANERLREEIEERRQAQERFSKAFHISPAASALQTLPELRYIDVNDSFTQLIGYSHDELVGGTAPELTMPVEEEEREKFVQRLLDGESIEPMVSRLHTRTGEVRHVLAAAEPIEVDGEPCVLVKLVDITDLRRAQERFTKAFQFAPVAASLSRASDGYMIDINARYTEVTGYTRDELIGRTATEVGLVDESTRERWANRLRQSGDDEISEAQVRTKDGEVRDIAAWATVIEMDGETALLTFFHDITERKQLEAELEAHRDRLQTLVEARTQELAAKNEQLAREVAERKATEAQLKQLNELLDQRVTERTREVRALASELTLAEQRERQRVAQILHDHVQQLLHGLRIKFSLLQQVEAERRASLVTEMDAVAKEALTATRNLVVGLSPPLLRDEGLPEALQWLARQMQELHGLTVNLDVQKPSRMLREEMRVLLFQVVRELLFNVVKHAHVDEAFVHVSQQSNTLVVEVEDHGEGFDSAGLHDETEPRLGFGFHRAQERLGLFGGSLEIESTPGEGTRATIRVPLADDPDDGTRSERENGGEADTT